MPAGRGIGARATWERRDILFVILLAIASIVILGAVIIIPAIEVFGEDEPGARALQGLTIMLWDGTLIFFVYWLMSRRGSKDWANLGWRKPWQSESWSSLKMLRIGAAAYGTSLVAIFVYNLVITVAGLEDLLPSEQIPKDFFDEVWLIPIIGLSVVVTAPVSEELFFRGFIYAGLRRRLKVPVAALLTGFLFSMAHADPGLVVPFTLIGAILALVYERTGSIWTNIGVHFWFNMVSFIVLVFVPGARG